jgi:CRP-like cAMP-binding protein
VQQHARNNTVLRAIPSDGFSRLLLHMKTLDVQAKDVLHHPGEPIDYICFPTTALVSMLMPTSDGETVELATVGREGFTGVSAILNGAKAREHGSLAKVVTVIPGTVVQIKADVFEAAVSASPELTRCIHRYLSHLFIDLALSVSCNRLHSLEQRCARWLLNAMDKSGVSDVIPITQETLAGMLGVYRQSVVQVLSELETKRVIQCGRGTIRVESRERLAAIVCECYYISKKRADRS